MVQRLSYRRQNSYATRSNRVKVVKTPGGKLAYIYTNKTTKPVKCGDCGCALNGIPAVRPTKFHGMSKNSKTVNRAYGGSNCSGCVRKRIVRAFLIEEQRIVKKVLKSKASTAAVAK